MGLSTSANRQTGMEEDLRTWFSASVGITKDPGLETFMPIVHRASVLFVQAVVQKIPEFRVSGTSLGVGFEVLCPHIERISKTS
jgi:hypothetical protein